MVGHDLERRPEAVYPEKTRKFQKYIVKVNNYQILILDFLKFVICNWTTERARAGPFDRDPGPCSAEPTEPCSVRHCLRQC
jgi:hypothetical protein